MVCFAAVISAACVAVAFGLNKDQKLEGEIMARMDAVRQQEVAKKATKVANENTEIARNAVVQAEEEKRIAAEALLVAQNQKSLAEKSRERTSRLLLENSLKEIPRHKETLRIPEAIESIDSAIGVAEEVGDAAILSGLRSDREFLSSLAPAISKLDRVEAGDIYPISDRCGIVSVDGYVGRLFDLKTRKPYGRLLQIPTPGNKKERLVHAWSAEDSFQWATVVADPSGQYWKHARIHKVLLESASQSSKDGPDIQPVSLDVDEELPVWISADGKTIAWRPRDNTQVIAVHATEDMKEFRRIKSPEFEFHSAALSSTGNSIAIAETDDQGQFKLSLHKASEVGRRRSLGRKASAVRFLQEDGAVAMVEDGTTKVIDLENGELLAEIPGSRFGLMALDPSRSLVASYLPGRLAVYSRNAGQSRSVPLVGEADGLEIDREGRCVIFSGQRAHLVDKGRNCGSVVFNDLKNTPFKLFQIASRVAWPKNTGTAAANLELVGMSENNQAFLVSSETSDKLARVDNDFVRYRVKRYLDLSVFRFEDQSRRAVSLQGFSGRVALQSVSTKVPASAQKAEKANVISPLLFQRMLTSGDSITVSESGEFAVVRDMGTTQRLRACTTGSGQFYGDFHLTHSKLTEPRIDAKVENEMLKSGPVRFDRSEKMFVYRIDDGKFGIVETKTGERTGPTLQLEADQRLLEVGWTLDSSKIWCLGRDGSHQLELSTFEVVSGEKRTLKLPAIGDLQHFEYGRLRDMLLINSSKKYVCVDVLGNSISRQGSCENNERILCCLLNHDRVGIALWNVRDKVGSCQSISLSDSESYSSETQQGTIVVPANPAGKVSLKRLVIPSEAQSVRTIQILNSQSSDPVVASLDCVDELLEVAFSANGRFAISTTTTGRSILWHLPTSRQLGPSLGDLFAWPSRTRLSAGRRFVFSPDSKLVLALDSDIVVAVLALPELQH